MMSSMTRPSNIMKICYSDIIRLLYTLLILLTYFAFFSVSAVAQSSPAESNPFGVGGTQAEEPSAQPPQTSPFGSRAVSEPQRSAPVFSMPAPVRAVFRQVADWQREINRYLGRQLQASSSEGGINAALTVILASFIYGVLHAAGPGHGKLVVASYFTAKRAPLKTGILMGGVIALTQAVVAILMVTLLAMVMGGSQLEIIDQTTGLEVVSYGLILAIGLYMTYGALTGKATCGHDHDACGHDHDARGHDHEAHEHVSHSHSHSHNHSHHGHTHGPDPQAKETWLARKAGKWLGPRGEVIAIGMVSGMRPCTGSILVLLFAVANGVFLLGIIASFMMAAGVAITISALGIGAIVLRKSVAGDDSVPQSQTRAFLGKSLSVAGSLTVAILGGLLFGGALERTGFLV